MTGTFVFLLFYDLVTKQLQIFVGFGWIRPELPRYCDEFTMMCNNAFGNTAIRQGVTNACMNRA